MAVKQNDLNLKPNNTLLSKFVDLTCFNLLAYNYHPNS